jgi:tetratricopeptide (TPR) repeat protein
LLLLLFCLACNARQAAKNQSSLSPKPAESNTAQPAAAAAAPASAGQQSEHSISYATDPGRFVKYPTVAPAFTLTNPKTAMEHFDYAIHEENEKRLQSAIAHYQEAVRLKPDFATAYYRMAKDYLQMGKPEQAIAQWKQATRVEPRYYEAYTAIAFTYKKQGDMKDAIAALSQLLEFPQTRMPTQFELGYWCEDAGDRAAAQKHFQAYRELAAQSGAEQHSDRFQMAAKELQKLAN